MRHKLVYAAACLLAFLAPWLSATTKTSGVAPDAVAFPGWPTHFEGRALAQLPLTEREERFGSENFPGRVARFTDGRRELVFRFVNVATRKLHPASDCFAAIGYRVRPLPLRIDGAGARWGAFTAERGGDRLRVYERIYADAGGDSKNANDGLTNTDGGRTDASGGWADVSAWYWAALGGASHGPWWAVTIAERDAGS